MNMIPHTLRLAWIALLCTATCHAAYQPLEELEGSPPPPAVASPDIEAAPLSKEQMSQGASVEEPAYKKSLLGRRPVPHDLHRHKSLGALPRFSMPQGQGIAYMRGAMIQAEPWPGSFSAAGGFVPIQPMGQPRNAPLRRHSVQPAPAASAHVAETANAYVNLGDVYKKQHNYEEALTSYQKALSIREQALGRWHIDTARAYTKVGTIYYLQGEYSQALFYYLQACRLKEQLLGLEHPETATAYNNLGVVYNKQGNYTEALTYYTQECKIKERAFGTNDLNTATAYHNLGSVYNSLGQYQEAAKYYEKACKLKEKLLGKEHPQTARTYNNLGALHADQGNYKDALKYYEKALHVQEQTLGTQHRDTACLYNNIAVVYGKQGRNALAIEYHEKALTIQKRLLGRNHPDTVASFHNLSLLYASQGKPQPVQYLEITAPKLKEKAAPQPNDQVVISMAREAKQPTKCCSCGCVIQ